MAIALTPQRRAYLRDYQLVWVTRRRNQWIKENGPCKRCGSTDNLEVDHIDRKTKLISPTKLWSLSKDNPKRVEELKKCQVLCSSCHKLKNQEETVTACARHRRTKHKCDCYN